MLQSSISIIIMDAGPLKSNGNHGWTKLNSHRSNQLRRVVGEHGARWLCAATFNYRVTIGIYFAKHLFIHRLAFPHIVFCESHFWDTVGQAPGCLIHSIIIIRRNKIILFYRVYFVDFFKFFIFFEWIVFVCMRPISRKIQLKCQTSVILSSNYAFNWEITN